MKNFIADNFMEEKVITSFNSPNLNLVARGYSVIPEYPKSRIPVVKDWCRYSKQLPTEQELLIWDKFPNNDTSLVLGEASGVIALDLDYNIDGLHEKILDICGTSPLIKRGSKGATYLFKYNGERSKSFSKKGVVVAEILAENKKTTIPPSIHPKTNKPYEWIGSGTLHDIDRDSLPSLPNDFMQRLDMLFSTNENVANTNLDEVRTALTFIDATDYQVWIKIGIALKKDLKDTGLELFKEWSKTAYNSASDKDLEAKWNSFPKDGELSLGTIFFLAIQNGYTPPRSDNIAIDYFIRPQSLRDELEEWRTNGKPMGTKLDLGYLDNLYQVSHGEYTVITGYSGSGKSEFVDSLSLILAEKGWKHLICSMEKTAKGHVESLIHKITGKHIKERTMQEQDSALDFINQHYMFLGNGFNCSIEKLDAMVAVKKKLDGVDLLIVDPYNYMNTGSSSLIDFNAVAKINIGLANIARKYNIAVILVAHPKNAEEDKDGKIKKVTINSIAGGTNFRNVADFVLAVHRGNMQGVLQIETLKVRDQTDLSLGIVTLNYDKTTKKYTVV
jgi:energy-coupling factor transporter ATP-binding protein EcfA2